MLQGAGSNVGKSLLAAGLCRALCNRGLKVAPFKPQNMSNNAAVTPDGGEIGRAQAVQARACRMAASVHMNPVLLKPESDRGAQLVVQGRLSGLMRASEYGQHKARLLPSILDSFERIGRGVDFVVVEGAGSAAETNLRAGDVANMGFAEAADVPVIMIGDIDRGGVIAQLVGTMAVLSKRDAARVRGFVVNRFRGDPELFRQGYEDIARRTGWPGLGVVPWFAEAGALPAEDAQDIDAAIRRDQSAGEGEGANTGADNAAKMLHIAVPRLPRIANFDDLDPLKLEPHVRLTITPPGEALPGDADLIIIPGTKSSMNDLAFFRAEGWDIDLQAHLRRGGRILGICGGYQMLGRRILDPLGVEGGLAEMQGLGLLDVETQMAAGKQLGRVRALHTDSGETVHGYEIHMGRTTGPDCARPLFQVGELRTGQRAEGARSACGLVSGSYLHGCFSSDSFRAAFLQSLGGRSTAAYDKILDGALDRLALHLETHLNIDAIIALGVKNSSHAAKPVVKRQT